jgi:DNA-binding NarL/FixJ family response regulator
MQQILIADPDPVSRRALVMLLNHKLGMSGVQEIGDMETLIRSLAKSQPDILLLDWRLYGAPAPETCQLMRKAYPELKIVLLSVDDQDAPAALSAGAIFIHKGASPDDVMDAINSLIGNHS